MKTLLSVLLLAGAILLMDLASKTPQPQPPRSPTFVGLGNSYRDPDNRQAQSQKKEGAILCPPFCLVQEQGRWHNE
jgi:hypothetical protein